MKLIITRHGETLGNKEGILQGHLQGTLSELGKEQARKVAERLKEEKIDYIYSSDLARASDTAKEIAKFHPNIPIEFIKELRESCFGSFEGKKISDICNKRKDLSKVFSKDENVENGKQLYERAKEFLDKLIRKHHKDIVLLVSHDCINKALICVITNIPKEKIFDIKDLHNTSINIYEIDEDRNHKVHLFNCNKHLA